MDDIVYSLQCPPHWVKTPPLGLEFIRKYCAKKGINVRIIDLNVIIYKLLKTSLKEWLTLNKDFEQSLYDTVKEKYPDIIKNILLKLENAACVGFYLSSRNKHFTYRLAGEINSVYPNKKIALGGPEVLFKKLRNEPFDERFFWVIGEGEKALDIILNSKNSLIIDHNEIDNLDEIPFLDFNGFNLKLYSNVFPLYSSRGCVRKCTFCTERFISSRFRQHSPYYVIEQIKIIMNKHKINYFTFQDSILDANLHWLQDFLTLLLKENINIHWEAQIAVRKDFPLSLAELLRKSGCFNLFVGLESASNKVLSAMNKGFTKEDARLFFEILRKAGLQYEISIIAGYPREEESDFKETIDFIAENKAVIPKIAQVNPYINYFSSSYTASKQATERVQRLISLLRKENIPYTKSFINNLLYKNDS